VGDASESEGRRSAAGTTTGRRPAVVPAPAQRARRRAGAGTGAGPRASGAARARLITADREGDEDAEIAIDLIGGR